MNDRAARVPSPGNLYTSLHKYYIRVAKLKTDLDPILDPILDATNFKIELAFNNKYLNDPRIKEFADLNRRVVAVKYAKTNQGASKLLVEVNTIRELLRERSGLHLNILEALDWDSDHGWWMISRVCSGGSLRDLRERLPSGKVYPAFVWHVLHQLIGALAFLHAETKLRHEVFYADHNEQTGAIAHCNITEDNICFDLEGPREHELLPNIRLIDFGSARAASGPADVHLAKDLARVGHIFHMLAHPAGFDRQGIKVLMTGMSEGTCECRQCFIPGSEEPFKVEDKDFFAIIAQLMLSQAKKLRLADYGHILYLAAVRRAQAYEFVDYMDDVPDFKPVVTATYPAMLRSVDKHVYIAEQDGCNEPWVTTWRERLDHPKRAGKRVAPPLPHEMRAEQRVDESNAPVADELYDGDLDVYIVDG